jgi:cytochrome d ubiquinol oxidase subunit II
MPLYDLPMLFALIGLTLYAVLGGADFGAGAWQLAAGRGELGRKVREHAHHSMAPVWEANHVWLIFVLTVVWTAYPSAFGAIASTLSIPLFLAAIGIILRGAAYALRSGTSDPREELAIDTVTAVSSILTPFALGTMIGGIASGRVPPGNAAGDLWSSWLNPTSILIGVLSVVTSAYLAAVFLAADAERIGDAELAETFRRRALGTAAAAGAVAVAGLVVLHSDARRLFDHLVRWPGLLGLVLSGLAGVATLALVAGRRYEPARYTSGLAVAAIIAGWALAQNPVFLPGLTVRQAAAPHDSLVAIVVAVIAGGALLAPSLALLFRLTLVGRLRKGEPPAAAEVSTPRAVLSASLPGLLGRTAVACVVVGAGLIVVADDDWLHGIGAVLLLLAVAFGTVAAAPALAGAYDEGGGEDVRPARRGRDPAGTA